MSPSCEIVEIAGSIRRGKPDVKDIEICAVPKFETVIEPTNNLFDPTREVDKNLLFEWAWRGIHGVQWIKPGTSEIIVWKIKEDGKYWRGRLDNIKLDLFIAGKDNFGVIFTIRTGSAEFSQALVSFIKHRTPFRVAGGNLILEENGQVIPCPTEDSFFENAGIEFVPVEKRSCKNPYTLLKMK